MVAKGRFRLTLTLFRRVRVFSSAEASGESQYRFGLPRRVFCHSSRGAGNPRSEPPASGRCPFGGRLGSGHPLRVPTRQREGVSGWEAPPAGGRLALGGTGELGAVELGTLDGVVGAQRIASTLLVRSGGARAQWAPDQGYGSQLRGMSAESGADG